MSKTSRQLLFDLYHSYLSLARARGLPFMEVPVDELEAMSDFDLASIITELKAVVRTPLPR